MNQPNQPKKFENGKIYFVGAGPGATDLITVRGRELLRVADIVVYAGSLVNPKLLDDAKEGCVVRDSASMTLEEVADVLIDSASRGLLAVRLHTGDPSLYGAIREQMDILRSRDIAYEVVPGVSSFSAAAAALRAEYTLPCVSQSLIVTRAAGRTPVPDRESLRSFASHGASMALFLSSGMIARACAELVEGGYAPHTPAAIVYKASWPEQRILRGDLTDIAGKAEEAGIDKTALILVGDFLGDEYERSKLYDPTFSHEFRKATASEQSLFVGAHTMRPPDAADSCRMKEGARFVPLHYAAFTSDGIRTAQKIQERLGGAIFAPKRFVSAETDTLRRMDGSVRDWAAEYFSHAAALVFVSAAGIAVRAIASCVNDKTTDPAVVCLDDLGQNVIPLLSGHIGGANDLASKIAEITGGNAVLTTSTDVHGIHAVDSWATEEGMRIENPEAIRDISSAMLSGEAVGVAVSELDITPPWPVTLWLRPKNLVLGVGCKKGVAPDALESAVADFLGGAGVSALSVAAVASIDLKIGEPAIAALCEKYGVQSLFYSADELNALDGDFSSSRRVLEVTGTDNVCERAALLAARNLAEGGHGVLMRSKAVYDGITLALAKIRERSHG